MDKINEEIRVFGMKVAQKQDEAYVKELGNVLLKHEDLKRFLRSRLIMQVTPLKINQTRKDDGICVEVSQGYTMGYNWVPLLDRIKFFVFDVSLWFKTKVYGTK